MLGTEWIGVVAKLCAVAAGTFIAIGITDIATIDAGWCDERPACLREWFGVSGSWAAAVVTAVTVIALFRQVAAMKEQNATVEKNAADDRTRVDRQIYLQTLPFRFELAAAAKVVQPLGGLFWQNYPDPATIPPHIAAQMPDGKTQFSRDTGFYEQLVAILDSEEFKKLLLFGNRELRTETDYILTQLDYFFRTFSRTGEGTGEIWVNGYFSHPALLENYPFFRRVFATHVDRLATLVNEIVIYFEVEPSSAVETLSAIGLPMKERARRVPDPATNQEPRS